MLPVSGLRAILSTRSRGNATRLRGLSDFLASMPVSMSFFAGLLAISRLLVLFCMLFLGRPGAIAGNRLPGSRTLR
jgi:hypothetical protein